MSGSLDSNLRNLKPDPAAALYHGDSGREYHERKRGVHPAALPWLMRMRAAKLQPYVRASDTVFEYGVGAGWNLALLQCARKIGFDTSTFLEPSLRELGIEFIPETSLVPSGSADAAICHQTLEHLLNPAQCLAELQRILKPSGTLILHVPWERESRYSRFNPSEPNHHLFTWSVQNIGNLVTVCGFRIQVIRLRKYGYERFASNWALRLHLGEGGFHMLRSILIALRPYYEVEVIAAPPLAG